MAGALPFSCWRLRRDIPGPPSGFPVTTTVSGQGRSHRCGQGKRREIFFSYRINIFAEILQNSYRRDGSAVHSGDNGECGCERLVPTSSTTKGDNEYGQH